ncbi:hypothetical protein Tco_0543483 [Tanacetum coccineum]
MNPQETQQVITRDEKWVPFTKRVKINSTNVRLETTMHQKEETFQVVINVIKNSTCFKEFTITAEVLEIFMQQFWYTIKKVKDLDSYEFLLANKKCIVDADVFRNILDICPRVEGEEFTEVQDDDATLTFLIDIGYKGPLHKYTNMCVDRMHQPWRTLVAIINKCLSRKTVSNDRLRKSRINMLWGMFYRENVNYPKLIWEDIAFQIDHMKEKRSRHEIIPFPRFTKVIINHFLSQHKRAEVKGHKGRRLSDTSIADVDVLEESDPEPARKRTASRRVIKKKVIISADDNIIPYLNVALELGKSISLTEAAEEEATRQVHATHARIVTEFVPEPARRRPSGIAFRDTFWVSKKVSPDPSQKLKGVQSLTPEEQLAADIIQALKESKKTSRRQSGTGGSSERASRIPGIPDESTIISATSSKGTSTKPGVPNEEKEVDWIYFDEDGEKKDDADDDKSIDLEMTDDEETEDEFIQGEEKVNDNEDEEMSKDGVAESEKDDGEITNAAKANAEKTEEVKDDAKKAKLPPTSSSLSVSSGFGDQFLKLSSDTSLVGTVKDTTYAEIKSLVDVKIQQEIPHIQSLSVLNVPVSVITEPSILIPILETPLVTAAITLLNPLSVSTMSHLRVVKLEKDVVELNKIDHSTESLATFKSQVPMVIDNYLETKLDDSTYKVLQRHSVDLIQKFFVKQTPESRKIQTPTINLEQESEKSALDILKIKKEQAKKQKMPKYTIKFTNMTTLNEYDQKSALYQTMHDNKSFNRNPANHKLYHALMEALIEDENDMDKGVGKKTKRRKKESEFAKQPSTIKETSKGKALSKGSKTGKFATAKESVKEPIVKVEMDDAVYNTGEDVPLPLKGCSGHLTVATEHFFNNDLEFLKSSDLTKNYTTLITKIKAARYEIMGIEDMVPTLWSPTKVGYDKDALKGYKH